MLALVLAMITLQNAAPDAVATPSAAIANRLPGAKATGLQGLDTSSPFGDVSVTVGCTYGVPRLGSTLANDFNAIGRVATAPACTNAASPLAFGPAALVPFYRSWAPAVGIGAFAPLEIQGGRATETPTFTMVPRSYARVLDRLALPSEFRGGAGAPTIATDAMPRVVQTRRPQPKH